MPYSYRTNRTSFGAKRRPQGRNYRGYNAGRGGRNQQTINPMRFIKAASMAESEVYVPKHAFNDFDLNSLLQANLAAKGYKIPSPIQDQTIPAGLEDKDIIGIAGTGTGKTAAFALPILNKLIADRSSNALIIAPTRELAQQIEAECRALGKGSGLSGAILIGGANMGPQLRDLRDRPRIVIGTPGRIKDHLQRGSLRLGNFNMVVLDEVDRMLDMGFVDDVTEILSNSSQQRQSFYFSATMDPKVRRLIDNFTKDPVTVSLGASAASENVHQDVVRYQGNADRIDKLQDILLKEEVVKAIIFDETQRSVERLSNELLSRGFLTDAIHGGKSQGKRQRALAKFKNNEANILVATNVAARGIDVVDITHVINFSAPKEYDDYIHRIGRAGRAGKVGHALTFVAQ